MSIPPVEIWVWQNALRQVPPKVWCRESWMRDDADWHNCGKGGMCWVLEEQWRDEMDRDDLPTDLFLGIGLRWLLTASINLIDRHYVGHFKKLKFWPKEWDAFSHFNEGAREYEREKRLCVSRKRGQRTSSP